jgi:acyl carrier protein
MMAPEALIASVFRVDPATISDATEAGSIDGWDSLGHVMLMAEIEHTYGISLSADQAIGLTSVRAIREYLTERGVRW